MPKQVSDPDYHSENHTAAQTCGWTKNALKGEGKCYKNIFYGIESHRWRQPGPQPGNWRSTAVIFDSPLRKEPVHHVPAVAEPQFPR